MRRHVLALSLLLFCGIADSALGQPTLTLSEDRLYIDGVTPGGELALFGVARRGLDYFIRLELVHEVLAADASGRADFRLELELEPRSVWAVVDLETGVLTLASPSSGGPRETPFAPGALFASRSGEVDRLRHDHRVIEALVVRPGSEAERRGVWSLRLADGDTATDADGSFNRSVTLAASSLEPVSGQVPPSRFEPGDVIIMIDPDDLEVSAMQIAVGPGAGGER
jgi:hypothetical protein